MGQTVRDLTSVTDALAGLPTSEPILDEIALAISCPLSLTGSVGTDECGQVGETDIARFIRRDALPGVEVLHATFIRHRYAPHSHEDLTIAYVEEGVVRFAIENHNYVAPPGTVFLIPPEAIHTCEPGAVTGYTYRVLYLELTQLATSLGRTSLPYTWRTASSVIDGGELAGALKRFHDVIALPSAALEQGEALAILARMLDDVLCATVTPRMSRMHPAVRAARDYIHTHWCDDFSLEELARAVGLSPFHLARCFRSHVGVPPSAYRRVLRVEAARQLLRQGEPPSSVAARCGFYDQAHLNRHFKRNIGVTPMCYAHCDRA